MGNAEQSAYAGIQVTQKMLDATLVKDNQGKWFRFALWVDRIFIVSRREEWNGWKDFDSGWLSTDIEELRDVYRGLFQEEAPRNAVKVTLTKAIWAKRYLQAADRSDTYNLGQVKDPVTGEKERKRSLDRRGYRALEGESNVHLQNQALIVHRELLKLQQQIGEDVVSESQIADMMQRLKESGILKTKQDPFRIFQYYRPALISAGKLQFVDEQTPT